MTTGHVKANSGMTDQETWARQWVAVTLALKTAETKYASKHPSHPQSQSNDRISALVTFLISR
jgi:hypothetical protein